MDAPIVPPPAALEDVSIDHVSIGDYIYVAGGARCVRAKATTRLADRVTGWRIELTSGDTLWLRRGAIVSRRAFEPRAVGAR